MKKVLVIGFATLCSYSYADDMFSISVGGLPLGDYNQIFGEISIRPINEFNITLGGTYLNYDSDDVNLNINDIDYKFKVDGYNFYPKIEYLLKDNFIVFVNGGYSKIEGEVKVKTGRKASEFSLSAEQKNSFVGAGVGFQSNTDKHEFKVLVGLTYNSNEHSYSINSDSVIINKMAEEEYLKLREDNSFLKFIKNEDLMAQGEISYGYKIQDNFTLGAKVGVNGLAPGNLGIFAKFGF